MGFSNAELLQDTDWEKNGAKFDPKKSVPKHPRWVFDHDAEDYAEKYYFKTLESMKKGIPVDEDDTIEPNFPRGYKYEPWTIDSIIEDKKAGRETQLGSGNWE